MYIRKFLLHRLPAHSILCPPFLQVGNTFFKKLEITAAGGSLNRQKLVPKLGLKSLSGVNSKPQRFLILGQEEIISKRNQV